MPALNLSERFIMALKIRGYVEQPALTRYQRFFDAENNITYFVGRNGALRYSRRGVFKTSTPATEKFKQHLLDDERVPTHRIRGVLTREASNA